MTYKRPEDQYKIPKAREMIQELNKKTICNFSLVMPYTNISFHGTLHSGVITHKCNLEITHKNNCCCLCGFEFKGY